MSFNISPNVQNSQPISLSLEQGLDRAWAFINNQDVPQAQKACIELNERFPQSSDVWYASSFLAFQLKQFIQADLLIDKAIELAPHNAQWQLHKAHCLLRLGNINSANHITEILSKTSPDKLIHTVEFYAELALVLNALENFKMAEVSYQTAINLMAKTSENLFDGYRFESNNFESNNVNSHSDPLRKAQLYFNLASIQRYLGKVDEAERSLNQAIKLNPSDIEAYLLRSSLKKQTQQANHLNELKSLLTKDIKHPIAKAQLYYALAKENEDLAQYPQSFDYLQLGAQFRRNNMRYEINHDLETLEQIINTFNQAFFDSKQKAQTQQSDPCTNNLSQNSKQSSELGSKQSSKLNQPIFILGLPRTGSTLVDRILSNHSEVTSAGELNDFAQQMTEQIKNTVLEKGLAAPKNKRDLVSLSTRINFEKLGKAYIQSTRSKTKDSTYFIDKLPLNSLYVGLIHLALPEAKIIHVTRHPLDTCYAIYKQLFTHGYPFSYDLTELGQYYIAHHRLMSHWQKVLPQAFYQIAYENVIDDIETEAKALVNYCSLDWQGQCIDFQKNQAPSTTASATQVRQGIYKTSQGKWRHFAEQLAPLKAQLEQAGICCD